MDQEISKNESSIKKINFSDKENYTKFIFSNRFFKLKKDLRQFIKLSTLHVDKQNSEKFSAKNNGMLLWSDTQTLNLEEKEHYHLFLLMNL